MLEFRDVTFKYDGLLVLDELSLKVSATEFVCLLGPSGSGKTTIVNLAAGFLLPATGEVNFESAVVTGPSSERVVVFQEDGLFPWFTVSENATFGARATGEEYHSASRSAGALLAKAGLSGFEKAFPRQLSGGMKKRTELVRAFASKSKMLLLDEPFGSLDVSTRQRMRHLFESLWLERQKCVLMVTHDPEEALLLADRVIILSPRPGRVVGEVIVPWKRPRAPEMKFEESFLQRRRELEFLVES